MTTKLINIYVLTDGNLLSISINKELDSPNIIETKFNSTQHLTNQPQLQCLQHSVLDTAHAIL